MQVLCHPPTPEKCRIAASQSTLNGLGVANFTPLGSGRLSVHLATNPSPASARLCRARMLSSSSRTRASARSSAAVLECSCSVRSIRALCRFSFSSPSSSIALLLIKLRESSSLSRFSSPSEPSPRSIDACRSRNSRSDCLIRLSYCWSSRVSDQEPLLLLAAGRSFRLGGLSSPTVPEAIGEGNGEVTAVGCPPRREARLTFSSCSSARRCLMCDICLNAAALPLAMYVCIICFVGF
mmetsp:Transcript_46330/g.114899  ORF Transcript_46330/g.114899 Transcript_46330/m.114899 type:complete len:238 (-) Transcript_46330:1052-1765(-)